MIDDVGIKSREDDTSFGAELGRTFAGFAIVGIFFAITGGILWLILK